MSDEHDGTGTKASKSAHELFVNQVKAENRYHIARNTEMAETSPAKRAEVYAAGLAYVESLRRLRHFHEQEARDWRRAAEQAENEFVSDIVTGHGG